MDGWWAAASGRWLRDGAVVAEVALAFVLLVGSGLMIRTFLALQNTDPGFDPNGVLTFLIQNNRAQGTEGRRAFQRTTLERLEAIPGVTGVTSAGPLPLDGGNSLARYGPLEAATDPAKFQQAITHFVQPGYFEMTRTPMHRRPCVHRRRQPSRSTGHHHRRPVGRAALPGRRRRRPTHARPRHHSRA